MRSCVYAEVCHGPYMKVRGLPPGSLPFLLLDTELLSALGASGNSSVFTSHVPVRIPGFKTCAVSSSFTWLLGTWTPVLTATHQELDRLSHLHCPTPPTFTNREDLKGERVVESIYSSFSLDARGQATQRTMFLRLNLEGRRMVPR